MPQDDPSPTNGKTPNLNLPDELHFERSPVTCRGCRQPFKHFVIEIIEDIAQLRCGSALISKIEMACTHCGSVLYWNIREKDLEKMTVVYSDLSAKISNYRPE